MPELLCRPRRSEPVKAASIEPMFDRSDAINRIQSENCPCGGCAGHLTSPSRSPGGWGFCKACRCAWNVSTIDGHDYATTIPSPLHIPAQSNKGERRE